MTQVTPMARPAQQPTAQQPDNITRQHPSFMTQQLRWELSLNLLGGTQQMKLARERFLPQGRNESDKDYADRLDGNVLDNYFKRTVNSLADLPTGSPVAIHEPSQMQEQFKEDVDTTGMTLTRYVRQSLYDMAVFGFANTLTSYTALPEGVDEETLTAADKEAMGLRPYFIRIPPNNLFFWSHAGDMLTEIRYRETSQDPLGRYGIQETQRIVQWTPGMVVRWKQEGGKSWAIESEFVNELGYIPLQTAYAGQPIAPFVIDPPLEGLADLNGLHWRQLSKQLQIELINRNPLLVLNDLAPADVQQFSVGPYTAVAIDKSDSERAVQFIESTGQAVEIGRKGLDALEQRMESLAVAPLTLRPHSPTATEILVDDSRSVSDLESWVNELEGQMGESFRDAEAWETGQPTEDIELPVVNISKEFQTLPDAKNLSALEADYRENAITLETFLFERKRYGIYADEFDPEEEAARVRAERNAMPPGGGDE